MFTCHYGQAVMERTLHTTNKGLEAQGQLALAADCPDLEAVLANHGYLREIKGEIIGNKLFLSGTVDVHLVYRGKESLDRVPVYGMVWKGTEGAVVNGEVELPDPKADWDWQVRLLKTKLQPETERTVKYQLELEVRLRAHEPVAVGFVEQIETEAQVHTEAEHLLVAEPLLQTHVSREFNNTLALIYPRPPLSRIISCQAFPVQTAVSVAREKVNIEGKLEVHLVYVTLTEDGLEGGLETQKWTEENGGALPFQISVEAPLPQESSVSYELWVESVACTSSHPESCRVQIQLGADVCLTRTRQVKAITDVSAEKGIIDLKREVGSWVEVVEETERSFVVEKLLTLPEQRPNIKNVLEVMVTEPKIEWELDHDQLIITGEALATLLYQAEGAGEEGDVITAAGWGQGGTEALTFGTTLDLPGVEAEMQARVFLNPQRPKVELEDERTIKLVWEFKAMITITQNRELSLVSDSALVLPEEGPKPSMLFYVVQPGDTLWGIARRYNTTMAALAKANQLTGTDQELVLGKKLLIPKVPIAN
ncbi:MAG TPA: LysM peptidoglycan-binding domain-containing protein [Firmicutes bacterium]|uniref:LysM peptidoglycan-binding domain-containing protein n=1 Tax=Capillibacterium thermochitinicola TaxID=2699427 RepID=A0A8J6LJC5_9FIRM|nr:LysM peptidoglycan-binding domain-containing protein [Capillibacterium thermochitinicola]MBA2133711.1 LysM peptidoglycan-binding domain-containing protein [Capillibacterium thermochitinicola]HHW11875.1 LysM peptidoglycan-binding domain-containing protein [Bacillota bacterium]